MTMIQLHKFSSNLTELKKYIPYKDISNTSDNYFRLFDIPDKLYLGKNSFRIRVNKDTIVPNSLIYIDLLDSSGNPIYHEVSSYLGEDNSRLIIIYVYDNTPPGEAILYIAGRIRYNTTTKEEYPYSTDASSTDFKDMPNLIWEKKVLVIPTAQNLDEIIYVTPPTIQYNERTEPYNRIVNLNQRLTTITGSNDRKISLKSMVDSYQYSNSSRFNTTFENTRNTLDVDPKQIGNYTISRQTQVPKYTSLSTVYINGFTFTPDMVGGNIVIRNINNYLATPSSSLTQTIPDFSASIVEVLDKETATVDVNFSSQVDNILYNTIINATDFTCSYYTKDAPIQTKYSESFLELNFSDLEPISGVVNAIKLSYKSFGSFGDFTPIGIFNLNEQNLLIDSSSIIPDKFGIVEKPIGSLPNYSDYSTYWQIEKNSDLDLYYTFREPTSFETGFLMYYTASAVISNTPEYFVLTSLKEAFRPTLNENTEYKLEVSNKLVLAPSASNIPHINVNQIDVYISGSSVMTDLVHQVNIIPPIKNPAFGTYIGSINTDKSKTILNSKLYFKSNDTKKATPIFVIRSGQFWEFKDITLSPRNESGYSPNVAKLTVPLNTFKTNTELVLMAEYMNTSGKRAIQDTKLIGVNFTGSSIHEILTDTNIVSGSAQIIEILDATALRTATFQNTHVNVLPGTGSLTIFNQTGSMYVVNNSGEVVELGMKINESHFDPNVGDIPNSRCSIWKNTTTNNVYLYVNDDGTLKKVQLT